MSRREALRRACKGIATNSRALDKLAKSGGEISPGLVYTYLGYNRESSPFNAKVIISVELHCGLFRLPQSVENKVRRNIIGYGKLFTFFTITCSTDWNNCRGSQKTFRKSTKSRGNCYEYQGKHVRNLRFYLNTFD